MSKGFTKESFDLKYRKAISGCWEWLHTKNQDGYGRVRRNGKLESAHRVSYELYKGPINGLHVLHVCDNPGCVNPDHLWLGTHLENQKDKKLKGRGRGKGFLGETHSSHKLTTEEVRSILVSTQTQSNLAKQFRVSQSLISRIKLGKNWKHISNPC